LLRRSVRAAAESPNLPSFSWPPRSSKRVPVKVGLADQASPTQGNAREAVTASWTIESEGKTVACYAKLRDVRESS
jgi:hypothetical protein